MKKLLFIAIALLFLGIGNAHAIVVPVIDGYLNPPEWDNFYFNATDPNENGDEIGEPNIPDGYDISLLRVWWDDTWAYVLTDLYGTPSFTKIDPTNFEGVYYQWNLDTTGDDVADLYIKLRGEDMDLVTGIGTLRIYNTSWTELATGNAEVHDVVEARFDTTDPDLSGYGEPYSMYMKLENQGGPDDDRLPNTGWTYRVPEPASAMLLGFGLLGLFGGVVRKRFKV